MGVGLLLTHELDVGPALGQFFPEKALDGHVHLGDVVRPALLADVGRALPVVEQLARLADQLHEGLDINVCVHGNVSSHSGVIL